MPKYSGATKTIRPGDIFASRCSETMTERNMISSVTGPCRRCEPVSVKDCGPHSRQRSSCSRSSRRGSPRPDFLGPNPSTLPPRRPSRREVPRTGSPSTAGCGRSPPGRPATTPAAGAPPRAMRCLCTWPGTRRPGSRRCMPRSRPWCGPGWPTGHLCWGWATAAWTRRHRRGPRRPGYRGPWNSQLRHMAKETASDNTGIK